MAQVYVCTDYLFVEGSIEGSPHNSIRHAFIYLINATQAKLCMKCCGKIKKTGRHYHASKCGDLDQTLAPFIGALLETRQ
jgi:hypothetical protein